MTDPTRTAAAKKELANAKRREAARAKRAAAAREAAGEVPTVTVGDLTLTLPKELPFALMFRIDEMQNDQSPAQVIGFIRDLFGDEQTQKIRDSGLSMSDGMQLIEKVGEAIGLTMGESSASETP